MSDLTHPRAALFEAGEARPLLPVCDHYAGTEVRMRKSLALQAQWGPVFDLTLDCEDGAPVGGETEHAHLVTELLLSDANRFGRVGVRVHDATHAHFQADLELILSRTAHVLAYVMVPKVANAQQMAEICAAVDLYAPDLPVHGLIEDPNAVHEAFAIAAHPRVQSLSFGLMDFVSSHQGALPASAMSASGQFSHPVVMRAKLEIAQACHAHGKVPSHCVVTEFTDHEALRSAALKASRDLGYTRMWSIHPDQIKTIVATMAPDADEVMRACDVLLAGQAAHWAPIRHAHTLHDRASYRFFWHVLERAQRTGVALPTAAQTAFFNA